MTPPGPAPSRVVIERVTPAVGSGEFPLKRIVGDRLVVEADVFAAGVERLESVIKHRRKGDAGWAEAGMVAGQNDRWRGELVLEHAGIWEYTVEAWPETEPGSPYRAALHRTTRGGHGPVLDVVVDPPLARFGAWYELFPRSCASTPGRHGTFRDVAGLLPRFAEMGFDVLYFPPIHPIGRAARKGRNNALTARAGDLGSPWAVGGPEGGHKSVHPELGTIEDFRWLLEEARRQGIEIALDIALHCSPDHPYVREHPGWFRRQADGSIRCAEGPPHVYEDVYPLDFECPAWWSLWQELRSIFVFWIEHGVRVFRVDNPHTKPAAFWQWLLDDLKQRWPDLIFLSEGLTRPKLMTYLAKVGFSQSYDYFPWRESKAALTTYYTQLTQGEEREFFRPSLWPNTPQLLPLLLQHGGPAASALRVILAATLGASYGIYGPAFELGEARAAGPVSTEYLDSEQYELKQWHWDAVSPLRDLITRLNRIRRANVALQANDRLRFHATDNEHLIAYSKSNAGHANVILTVVNLDPHHVQSGWTELDLPALGLEPTQPMAARDLLSGETYHWRGPRNYVQLDPQYRTAHVLRLEVPPP